MWARTASRAAFTIGLLLVWARGVAALVSRHRPALDYPSELILALTVAGSAVYLIGLWLMGHSERNPAAMLMDVWLFVAASLSMILPYIVEGLLRR